MHYCASLFVSMSLYSRFRLLLDVDAIVPFGKSADTSDTLSSKCLQRCATTSSCAQFSNRAMFTDLFTFVGSLAYNNQSSCQSCFAHFLQSLFQRLRLFYQEVRLFHVMVLSQIQVCAICVLSWLEILISLE